MRAGLVNLLTRVSEYCLWESQDRFDRCETCAARKQLYSDMDIYRQVATKLTLLAEYRSDLIVESSESCLESLSLHQERIRACSIPSQTLVENLQNIDTSESFLKGYAQNIFHHQPKMTMVT